MKTLVHRKHQTGATLMEVLIALLVFSVGLQGIASLQYQATKENLDSSQRSKAVWVAQELIDRMRANPDGRTAGDYDFNGNPCDNAAPANYCADTNGSDAVVCNSAQMATFDIWETVCPNPNQAQNQAQFINPNLVITCADAPCLEGSEMTVVLQWRSKAVTDDSGADGDISDNDDALKTQEFRQVFSQ